MPRKPVITPTLGGVDARSNPFMASRSRCIRSINWRLVPDGHMELREGYTPVTMSVVTAGAIHSMQHFRTTSGGRYLIFWQGKVPKLLNLANGTVTTPAIKGAAIASSSRFSYYLSNQRLHAVNGTDYKWLLPTDLTWRDIGLRALTAGDVAGVSVTQGTADPTGIAKSTVGGANPGYQFYACLYNRTSGHVGNRISIGTRLLYTDHASDVNITGLPNLAGDDSEIDILIGRTADGGAVPYPVIDGSGNWVYIAHGATSGTITQAAIDGNNEMPTLNNVPPANLFGVAQVGDKTYGITLNAPWLYSTFTPEDITTGNFVGRPEQSWNLEPETFPTAEQAVAVSEYIGDCVTGSLTDTAVLSDPMSTGAGWQGPWVKGWAGQFAGCRGWQGLPYWVSGEKQMCSLINVGPASLSEEYEATLLNQIADASLSNVEAVYELIPSKRINRIRFHFTGTDGQEHHVFHDFGMRDYSEQSGLGYSPYFAYQQLGLGQAYEYIYEGILASPHTICQVRDGNDRLRTYAGASDGQIYLLDDGVNDNGTEFSCDRITYEVYGDDRPLVGPWEWIGDGNTTWKVCSDPAVADIVNESNFETLALQAFPGDESGSHWYAQLNRPEMLSAIVRIQLDSHSADAPANGMALNDPPHCPLETYGRVWLKSIDVGEQRGK